MLSNNNKTNIILIGFMGCGKTTFGKALAKAIGFDFIDSDKEIEKIEKMTINDIFAIQGEEYFRKLESNFIQNFRSTNCVVATGGGMPCYNDNMKELLNLGKTFYIKVDKSVLLDRLRKGYGNRPMLKNLDSPKGKESILDLLNERESYYEKALFKVSGNVENERFVESITESIKLFDKG